MGLEFGQSFQGFFRAAEFSQALKIRLGMKPCRKTCPNRGIIFDYANTNLLHRAMVVFAKTVSLVTNSQDKRADRAGQVVGTASGRVAL